MKIISRYLLTEFLRPLSFILAAFVGLYVIAQLVDEMRMFVNNHAPLTMVVLYYAYRVPYFTIQVMPLAVLLSALLSLGQLARQNELIAMRSCGISFGQITRPLLLASLGLVGLVMIFDEVIIPYTNPRAEYIKRINIEHKLDDSYNTQRDQITRSLPGHRVVYMRHVDAQAGKMDEVIYLVLGAGMNILRRVDAQAAHYLHGQWIFNHGTERLFNAEGQVSAYRTFASETLEFREAPRDFIRDEKDDHQLLSMPMRDLQSRIRTLKEAGSNTAKEEVNYHLKWAFPFANFVLALLGVGLPFIFPSGRRALVGAAIGFVITLATGFFYIGFIAVGTSLGNNGTLSPVVSVWLANVVFSLLGFWLMRRARS
ncbi:MAG: YjgP/YjgQ family permease [Candidatus Firestonebacteria bacterium]|nr:YjgP/YjgQ family permease [Candidatus Firestonebacteria bacterium]